VELHQIQHLLTQQNMMLGVLLPQYLVLVDAQRTKEFIWCKMVFLEFSTVKHFIIH
jgi:hypothetical protein